MLKKTLLGLVGVLVLLGAGLAVFLTLFLPDRFAVNVPLTNALFGWGTDPQPDDRLRARISLPPGYHIGTYATDLGQARIMRWTTAGDLLVSASRQGEVKLVRAGGLTGRSGPTEVLLSELDRPHGLEIIGGYLYVGETSAIARAPFDETAGRITGPVERILTGLPGGGNHWTRTLRQGPDGWLYVNIGSSCNVCIEEDSRRGTLMRLRPDGSEQQVWAEGLRNTVGWDWQPGTGDLYGVDNGRDFLGDDDPPDELNLITEDGFYGWPFVNGFNVRDPDFGDVPDNRIPRAIAPAHGFDAHVAALSIVFVGDAPLPGLENAALVAQHGSWNRTQKIGYRVVSLHWAEDGGITEREFATGFEIDEDVIGRPVDITIGPDNAVYVSDDYAGSVYRIGYGAQTRAAPAAHTAPAPRQAAAPGGAAQAAGAALWAQNNCGMCHEAGANGKPLVALSNLAQRYDTAGLAALLRTPPANMPAVDLPDAQRRMLADYVLARFGGG